MGKAFNIGQAGVGITVNIMAWFDRFNVVAAAIIGLLSIIYLLIIIRKEIKR